MYFIPLSINDKTCKNSQVNIFKRNIHMYFLSQEVSYCWISHTDCCVCIKRQIVLMITMCHYLHQQVCHGNN